MIDRRPGEGRYAQLEREQRWLVSELPAGAQLACEIADRYIDGTRLRLRRMHTSDAVVFKLAQKVRLIESRPELVKLTNIYLSADEYDVLAELPGHDLRKSRWRVEVHGRPVAIDQYHDRWTGLVLAEVELQSGDEPQPLPGFAAREVTTDDRFSGGSLAAATLEEIDRLLDEIHAQSDDSGIT